MNETDYGEKIIDLRVKRMSIRRRLPLLISILLLSLVLTFSAIAYLGVKGRFFDEQIRPYLAQARMGTGVIFDRVERAIRRSAPLGIFGRILRAADQFRGCYSGHAGLVAQMDIADHILIPAMEGDDTV